MSRTAIVCAVLALAIVAFIQFEVEQTRAPNGEVHELHNIQVLKLGEDEYHYKFRDAANGFIFWAHFCEDYEPQFAPGMTLDVLKYEDRGYCWSVKNTHPAYLIKRDEDGKIIKEDFYGETGTKR